MFKRILFRYKEQKMIGLGLKCDITLSTSHLFALALRNCNEDQSREQGEREDQGEGDEGEGCLQITHNYLVHERLLATTLQEKQCL